MRASFLHIIDAKNSKANHRIFCIVSLLVTPGNSYKRGGCSMFLNIEIMLNLNFPCQLDQQQIGVATPKHTKGLA